MKNVIKSGSRKTMYQVECYNCGCVFTYLFEDTSSNKFIDLRNIDCPECEKELNHSEYNRVEEDNV